MPKIKKIIAREILDSRGHPTVEVDVLTDSDAFGRFCVPSGASTGEYEAIELRDKDPLRFGGKGVLQAVKNVNDVIAPHLIGESVFEQRLLDSKLIALDGTSNKSRLGANAILGVSLACAKAAANKQKMSLFTYAGQGQGVTLPVPLMNVINGGAHADNGLDIQEFMIVPYAQKSFAEALRCGDEVFQALKLVLKKKGLSTSVGDEGGFAPSLKSNEEALSLLCDAIEQSGYQVGKEVGLALDVAASEFYDREKNVYRLTDKGNLHSGEMVAYYQELVKKYPIVSIEDPFDQNDWEGFLRISNALGKEIQIVGDDLFVTNENKLKRGIDENIANAVLVKFNQVGTLTETLDTVAMAQQANYGVVWSHRSGETEDTSIADLAVATNAGQIKTGSLSRTDRVAKYNQLLRIEEELGEKAVFAGRGKLIKGV